MSSTCKGITVTASSSEATFSGGTIFIMDSYSHLSFSPVSGQSFSTISRIEITADNIMVETLSSGWSVSDDKLIWTGAVPLSSVTLAPTTDMCNVSDISKVEFTVQ